MSVDKGSDFSEGWNNINKEYLRKRHQHHIGDEVSVDESQHFHANNDMPYYRNLRPGDAFADSIFLVQWLNYASEYLAYVWWQSLDNLIALFIPTSEFEVEQSTVASSVQKLMKFLKALFFLLLLLVSTPFAILAFIIWLPLQALRPRSFSYYCGIKERNERQYLLSHETNAYRNILDSSNVPESPGIELQPVKKIKTYVLVTGNVCLMPEFLSRLNNVSNNVKRAEKISNLVCGYGVSATDKCQAYENQTSRIIKPLIDTELLMKTTSEISVGTSIGSKFEGDSLQDDEVISMDSSYDSKSFSSLQMSITSKERAVITTFPKSIDFLCLQEVFDTRAANVLLKGLRSKYPYIIYDVSWPIHDRTITAINSGLCIASKYPFLEVKFNAFPDVFKEDRFACKGLLMTKLQLGHSEGNITKVGYIATTHLQAITHEKASEVRCKQLNLIQRWLVEFKQRTRRDRESVMFDVICGDFNFDNDSHFEENERRCEFRQTYQDPCVNEATGHQHSWVVGTELIANCMHQKEVNTPGGLQRMLVSELERPQYVASTIPGNRNLAQTLDGKRRVDYILQKPCHGKKLVIKDYKFITGFATLTDHIPISMTFSVEEQ